MVASWDLVLQTSVENLPNMKSVYLYPSLCFFEGTNVSVGRGTTFPFQVYGAPYLKKYSFNFTPKSMFGAKHPKHQGEKCFGQKFYDLNEDSLSVIIPIDIAIYYIEIQLIKYIKYIIINFYWYSIF